MSREIWCLLSLITVLQLSPSQGKKVGEYFDVCNRNDPNLNSCIEKAINTGVRRIASGIPEINLPPMDPMEFDSVDMREGYGNFKFMMVLNNFTVEGFSNLVAENVNFDLKNESNIILKVDFKVPYAILRGKYITDGRVLIIPLKGDGDVFMNATSSLVKTTIKFRTVLNQKDNRNYLLVKSFDCRVTVGGGRSHFTNLFNGNKRLAASVNKFFSDHIPEIFDSIRHLPEKAFSAKFKEYTNILFKNYPYDEILLPDNQAGIFKTNKKIFKFFAENLISFV